MDELIESLKEFLDEEDQKILRSLSKDLTVMQVLKKVFTEPEKAEKYLILIRDNYLALLLTTKLAERISRYLEKEDEEQALTIFLKGISYLNEMKDRRAMQTVFSLLKEAIDSRLNLGKYETAAMLVTRFRDFGFNSYVKRLLYHALEISESGDFPKAARILDLLPQNEEVLTVKSYILLEWGKSIAVSDPEAGLRRLEEAVRIRGLPAAKIAMAEIYESIGNYAKAYEIYSALKNQPEVERKLLRLLMEWGEETKDLRRLEEARSLAAGDAVLLEEIDRRIKKLKENQS
jgi:tetratricopeptide (TPR) repeat protein